MWKLQLDDERRQETAYHEAGHFLISFLLGTTSDVEHVTIVPRVGVWGSVLHVRQQYQFALTRLDGKIGELHRLWLGMRNLAGECSLGAFIETDEWYAFMRQDGLHANGSDIMGFYQLYRHLPERQRRRERKQAIVLTEQVVTHPRCWKAVTALASQLMRDGRVTGEQARATMARTWRKWGPLPFMQLNAEWQQWFMLMD